MKKFKKSLALLFSVLMIVTMLAGCAPKEKPDSIARIRFNFIVKQDKSELSKAHIIDSDAQRYVKEEKDKTCKELKSGFTKEGMTVTDAKIESIYNNFKQAAKKLSATTSIVSQDKNTAKVQVKTNYIDFDKIIENAKDSAVSKVKSKIQSGEYKTRDEAEQGALDLYIEDLIEQLKNAKPSTDTTEKTFDFVLKDNVWSPQDVDKFNQDIVSLIQKQ